MSTPRRWNSTLGTSKPLERHAGLQRRTYLNAVNRERKARRRNDGKVYGPGYVWMTGQPCVLAGKTPHRCHYVSERNREAHHVRSVGAGGKDEANVVAVCALHHDLIHSLGKDEVRRRFNVDLEAEAKKAWALMDAMEAA